MPKQSPGQKAWYERNKAEQIRRTAEKRKAFYLEINQYKALQGCALCPEAESCCLEFHHINPKLKKFEVALGMRKGYAKERIYDEIAKCIVICSNCHRKLHAGIVSAVTH